MQDGGNGGTSSAGLHFHPQHLEVGGSEIAFIPKIIEQDETISVRMINKLHHNTVIQIASSVWKKAAEILGMY